MSLVKGRKDYWVEKLGGMKYVCAQPFQTARIKQEIAYVLLDKHATGKTFRNMQEGITEHEIEYEGELYILKSSDRGGFKIRSGSDL